MRESSSRSRNEEKNNVYSVNHPLGISAACKQIFGRIQIVPAAYMCPETADAAEQRRANTFEF